MALTIYGSMKSRAARVVWAAKELGIPYELKLVVQPRRAKDGDGRLATNSPAFLAINPNGRVPAIDDDGLIMFESLAINLHLARKHDGAIGPKDAREDSLMTMWTLWAVTECEPHNGTIQRNQDPPEQIKAAETTLARPLKMLDDHLRKNGGHPVGGRFTVADIALSETMKAATRLFADYPAVKTWFESTQARPAFKAMHAERVAEAD